MWYTRVKKNKKKNMPKVSQQLKSYKTKSICKNFLPARDTAEAIDLVL